MLGSEDETMRAKHKGDIPAVDRRSALRFGLQLPLEYRFRSRGKGKTGFGTMVNLSTTGILVHMEDAPGIGIRIAITIPWSGAPGNCWLELHIKGETVWYRDHLTAIRVLEAEFRKTRRAPVKVMTAGSSLGAIATSLPA
jgi:hypothetical protein